MIDSVISPDWYRVAALRPKLRDHVLISRHQYRGRDWYVIRDPISGRHHRVDSDGYRLIAHLDGEQNVETIWQQFRDQLGDDAPTQAEFVRVLEQLDNADLIQVPRAHDADALAERGAERHRLQRRHRFSNPLLVRFPLVDPDRLLRVLLPVFGRVFTLPFAIAWLALMCWVLWQAGANWTPLVTAAIDNALSPYNLVLLIALYPLVKIAHELGHGLAARKYGCEVHELGIAFLLFVPLPYVDVSPVNSLPNKYQRILVSIAGILVELTLAGFGLWLWLNAEPGLVRDIGFNLLLIGGVSTVLFNGNPLLKYDGYYVLADFVEIPALYERSTQYLQYLLKRYVLRVEQVHSNAVAPGERGWFVVYGLVSLLYRLALMWIIALYVAGKYFVVGVLLALFLGVRTLLVPLYKAFVYVMKAPQLAGYRLRGVATAIVLIVGVFAILSLPVPSFTNVQGVVWLPDEAQIRTRASGLAGPLLVSPDAQVTAGTPLLMLKDPLLDTRLRVVEAELAELRIRHRAALAVGFTEAENIRSDIVALEQKLQKLRGERLSMTVVAPSDGRLAIPDAHDIEGEYLDRGVLVGFVMRGVSDTARVVVPQAAIGRIQAGVDAVELRLSSMMRHALPATIVRHSPEAIDRLPSAALAASHGGSIRTTLGADGEPVPANEVFEFDVRFDLDGVAPHVGERVHVRFRHPDESMLAQLRRTLRQTFLQRFDV